MLSTLKARHRSFVFSAGPAHVIMLATQLRRHQAPDDWIDPQAVIALEHRYVLVTTTPEHVSPTLHGRPAVLGAPILTKPVDRNRLLPAVRDAAHSLSAHDNGPQHGWHV